MWLVTSSAVTKRQQRVCFSVVSTERALLPTVFGRTDLKHLKMICCVENIPRVVQLVCGAVGSFVLDSFPAPQESAAGRGGEGNIMFSVIFTASACTNIIITNRRLPQTNVSSD